jgi:hypothetical protein
VLWTVTGATGCSHNTGEALAAATFIAVTAVRTAAVLCGAEEVDCTAGPRAEPVYTGGYQEPYAAGVDW